MEGREIPGARRPTVNPEQYTYDRYVIERDPVGEENEKVMRLGLVGSRYLPLQNTEAFAFFEPISVEDRPHIFERFWSGKGVGGEGAGLGLVIVMEIVA